VTATTTRHPGKAKTTKRKYDGPSPEEKLAADLIALLEQGVNPWRRPWIGAMGEHRNLLTGHQYRGGNPLLLEVGNLSRGNTLPLWMGAGQAKAHGWMPAKGSKAARIAQPRPVTIEDDNAQPGEISSKARSFTVYKLVPVFNVADLVGVDEDSAAALARRIDEATGNIAERPEHERLAHAEDVLGAWEVKAQFGGALACYSPALDRISLPESRAFDSRETFCATWAHEQVHSTGHSSRLARNLSGSFGTPSYAREELIAEMGSAILCRRLGIGSELQDHASYLNSWIEVLREDPRALLKALGAAKKAADLIAPEAQAEEVAA
jgi:antirestriction protein ArdC